MVASSSIPPTERDRLLHEAAEQVRARQADDALLGPFGVVTERTAAQYEQRERLEAQRDFAVDADDDL